MSSVQELLSANLIKILKEKNLSQTQLAEKMGVTFQTINGIVNGSRSLSLGMLTKIAKALRVQESDLVSGEVDKFTQIPNAEAFKAIIQKFPEWRQAFLLDTWTAEMEELLNLEQQKTSLAGKAKKRA